MVDWSDGEGLVDGVPEGGERDLVRGYFLRCHDNAGTGVMLICGC